MLFSEHHAIIELDTEPPIRLRVNDGELTLDEEWVPFLQASLTLPLGDGAVAAIDPTADDIWATITTRKLMGRVDRLSDITRRFRGRTLAAVTTEVGDAVSDVTASTYHDYIEPGHPRREQVREFRAMLREVEVDEKGAQVSMQLASAEARLFDDAWQGTTPLLIPGGTLRECVDYVLARSGFSVTTFPVGGMASWVIGDARLWQPGQSAWDVLVQMVKASANPLIWCDELGVFRIHYERPSTATRVLRSAGPERSVTNAQRKRSRDENWYTAVMVVWTDELGNVTRGVATTPGRPIRMKVITQRSGIGPPSDPNLYAENIRARIVSRYESVDVTAVNDYALTPTDTANYVSPRGILSGRCSAVTWAWPADEMKARMREVTNA